MRPQLLAWLRRGDAADVREHVGAAPSVLLLDYVDEGREGAGDELARLWLACNMAEAGAAARAAVRANLMSCSASGNAPAIGQHDVAVHVAVAAE